MLFHHHLSFADSPLHWMRLHDIMNAYQLIKKQVRITGYRKVRSLTVDELLEKNIHTPLFSCNIHVPERGSLHLYETDKGPFIGEKLKREHLKPPVYESIYRDGIHDLRNFLDLAEAGFRGINIRKGIKDAGIKIPPEYVMEFCYIFGFPMIDICPAEDNYIYWGFYVNDFIQKLTDLYICYALWKALFVRDDSLQKKICPFFQTEDKMRSELQSKLMAENTICVTFGASDIPNLSYHTANLMALVKAQMAILVSKGKDYIKKGWYIDFCKDCGQPFIRKRTNSTRCPTCTGSTGKSRRYRANKKGVSNNG